jgi:small GTP-binding protein
MDEIKNKDKIFYSVKIIIIGDQNVGKTNIIHRFTDGEFSNQYMITIGMDYISHNIKINKNIFHLQLWDTAGSERFRSITKGYFSNSACAIIVYDITNEKSFDSIKEWVNECKLYTNKNIHLVLVGNKNDLKEQRKIEKEQGEELAKEYDMKFFEASALTGDNIEEIFVDICKTINKNINDKLYDLNDPSIGIKISEREDDMEINKTYETSSFLSKGSQKLNSKRNKRKCC